MVFHVPSRPLSLLIVGKDHHAGNVLRLSLQDSLGRLASRVDFVNDPKVALSIYTQTHPDVLLIDGFSSGHSEALIINARNYDGKRHTGVIVMAAMDEGFDQLAVNNYNAGADDVVGSNMSVAILRSKIMTVFNHKLTADELRAMVHKLELRTMTDELTGLFNMRAFMKKFGNSIQHCGNGGTGVAIVMMDLDHFKRVNDSMNHMVGSHVIKTVGHLLGKNQVFEADDFACRYGGDEYIMVLHGQSEMSQMRKADVIRELIASMEIKFQGHNVNVTCSMGLCWVPPGFAGKPEDMVKGADAMLYKSKAAGRNCLTGMILRYPVDFSHIGPSHLMPNVERELKDHRQKKKA